ncbi:unnamed protein product [Polarella glacialis]|uniref:Uncharacterized protein n=1 Tax=Polarella glacialis TaxID=89957 RepID=A0A813HXC8_POLGL|nr:unnamed protein product [Polarella glacialis]
MRLAAVDYAPFTGQCLRFDASACGHPPLCWLRREQQTLGMDPPSVIGGRCFLAPMVWFSSVLFVEMTLRPFCAEGGCCSSASRTFVFLFHSAAQACWTG